MTMPSSYTVTGLFNAFKNLKVLILGDVMVDSYLFGKVERISPEAPVPIVAVNKRKNLLGGAANVSLNVMALGATPLMCSVIGNDSQGDVFLNLLAEQGLRQDGICRSDDRPTTTKVRIVGNKMQMLRIDDETETDLNEKETRLYLDKIETLISTENVDVIIFEDYNKGVLTAEVISQVIALANKHGIPTSVDPKKKNFDKYCNVTLFKPNLKELREGLKLDINPEDKDSLSSALATLQQKQNVKIAMATLSEYGVFIRSDNHNDSIDCHHISAHLRSITDVSGAGDTVISVASLCLALKQDSDVIAALSNLAGGLVCEHVGVVPVDRERLIKESKLLLKDQFIH
ncbi:MAG: bifunctional ADP-heptose synthase [Bacteroidota bacterium]|nr:bifunctional ADP-heptose synthase [Bacteroidota bacterium]